MSNTIHEALEDLAGWLDAASSPNEAWLAPGKVSAKATAEHVRKILAEHPTPERQLEVIELGEDGEAWLVTGTTPETPDQLVHVAVAKHILDVCGIDEYTADNIKSLPEFATVSFRPDWGWKPVNPELPDDDAYLVHGDKVPAGVEKFAATRVSV